MSLLRTRYKELSLFLLIILGLLGWAQEGVGSDKVPSTRQKVIDFEGDLVEGVNKQPLDSLSEVSEARKRKRQSHLYRKRRSFRTETQETLGEMRYLE